MNVKNEVLVRAYVVLGVTVLVALLIYAKAVQIVLVDGDKWRSKSDSLYVRLLPVDAERGNILADDGSLIATSLPFFELRMDMMSDAMREEDFAENIDGFLDVRV